MRSTQIKEVRRLSGKGYRNEQIALVLGLTVDQVKFALASKFSNGNKEHKGSPDEIVDGETMQQRIERMKAGIRSGEIVVTRDR